MHDDIKRFPLEGTIGDRNLITEKERLVRFVETEMRGEGYVPVLDLHPHFTLDYDPESETFAFVLSVYGTHVGKEEACEVAGMMDGTTIMKSISPTKSKESSATQK